MTVEIARQQVTGETRVAPWDEAAEEVNFVPAWFADDEQ
jgi:hypothetical protein